jgi:hypothetical protein
MLNGDETDVDCGGSCGSSCASGRACDRDSDCFVGLSCIAKICGTPTTCEGEYTITSDAEFDEFVMLGCNQLNGNLDISGLERPNLTGLVLTHLPDGPGTGLLRVRNNPGLTSLEGLEDLSVVAKLDIGENPNLEQIQALSGLRQVDLWLGVITCPSLLSLSGLDGIESIGGDLYIRQNDLLTSLEPLDTWDPATLKGWLVVQENPQLPQCLVDDLAAYLDAECSGVDGCAGNLDACP